MLERSADTTGEPCFFDARKFFDARHAFGGAWIRKSCVYFEHGIIGGLIARIPDALDEKFNDPSSPDAQTQLNQMHAELKAWNQKWHPVLKGGVANNGTNGNAAAASTPGNCNSQQPARVLCQPVYSPEEEPLNVAKQYTFPEECIVPFEQLTELLSSYLWSFFPQA